MRPSTPDAHAREKGPDAEGDAQPIACALGALDFAERTRRWQRLLREAGLDRVELAHGLRLELRPGTGVEEELAALVALERECCAWASWQLRRHGGRLVMEASAPGEGAAALHGMFADVPQGR